MKASNGPFKIRSSPPLMTMAFVFAGIFGSAGAVYSGPTDIVINEILYNADETNPGGEFLELYNRGASTVDLSGWILYDAVRFDFPQGTRLQPGEYIVVCRNALEARRFYKIPNIVGEYQGSLNNAGDTITLYDNRTPRVLIEEVTYDDEPPWPPEADGGGQSLELINPSGDNNDPANWGLGQSFTPGTANDPVPPNAGDIVINEILYKAVRQELREEFDRVNHGLYYEEGDDVYGEYLEIYNRGAEVVDLTGWKFTAGISFEFAPGTAINPGAFLVIGSSPDILRARHGISNIAGQFSGSLADDGERITLRDQEGHVADTVRYDDEHPWPLAPDDFGFSLECIDPRADNSTAANWRASQAEFPSLIPSSQIEDGWQYVSAIGAAPSNNLYIYLLGPGEWLVDQIEIRVEGGGPNLLPNGSFEPNDSGWTRSGSHSGTFRTDLDAHDGTGSERVIATAAGGGSANSLNFRGIPGVVVGERYSLSFWAKYLSGYRSLSVRLSAAGLGAAVRAPYSLAEEWSETNNPNGPWSYRDGTGNVIASRSTNWRSGDLGGGQPAWTNAGDNGRPGWSKSIGAAAALDFPNGSVATLGPSEAWWTAPAAGVITVTGGLWLLRHTGSNQNWTIRKNQTLLANGELVSGETQFHSRNPKPFDLESMGAKGVMVEVAAGEAIKFGTQPKSGIPDYVGFQVTIQFVEGEISEPPPPIGGALGLGTPGKANSVFAENVPPLVMELGHFPEKPASRDPVLVTARVIDDNPIAFVRLETFKGTSTTPAVLNMFDDGAHGDIEAGDGIYGVQVAAQPSHTLIHYRVVAEDAQGGRTAFPYDDDPSPTRAYYSYDNDVNTKLPFYDLFISSENLAKLAANPFGTEYLDCSLAIDGIAYPHIGTRKRGRASRFSPKHQWKFQFNKAQLYKGNRTLDTFLNLPDQVKFAFDVFELSTPSPENLESELIRLHMNGGAFFGLYCATESPNSTWLDKHAFDPASEIYKARTVESANQFMNSDLYHNQIDTDYEYWGAYNKKTRPLERPIHIRDLVDNLNDLQDKDLLPWMDAHVDLDQWYKRWALCILMNLPDFSGHNFFLVLPWEPEGKWGKWTKLDYDFDHGFNPGNSLPAHYGDGVGGIPDWQRNKLYQRTTANPTLKRIYFLTMRKVIETTYKEELLYPKLDALFTLAAPDRSLDSAKWGTSRSGTGEIRSVIASQRKNMLTFLTSQKVPSDADIPTCNPPGGIFDQPVLATISASQGWRAVYTLDGTDPRLSRSRTVYEAPFLVEASAILKVAGISADLKFESGNWTGLAEYKFEIKAVPVKIGPFLRGDANGDKQLDLSDALTLLIYNFVGNLEPPCLSACDLDADGNVAGVTDAIYLLTYLFLRGEAPEAPYPGCGFGVSAGDLALGCKKPLESCP